MIIVIKNKEDVPLERFIFAVQHMIEVEESQRNLRSIFPLSCILWICWVESHATIGLTQCRECHSIHPFNATLPILPAQAQHG